MEELDSTEMNTEFISRRDALIWWLTTLEWGLEWNAFLEWRVPWWSDYKPESSVVLSSCLCGWGFLCDVNQTDLNI